MMGLLIKIGLGGCAAVVLLMQMLTAEDPRDMGREGNADYQQANFDRAARTYRAALEADPADSALAAALWSNYGSALYRMSVHDSSAGALRRGLALAATAEDSSRIAYNAGVAEAGGDNGPSALALFRTSLLADPSREDARYNYELVKRRMQEENQQQQQEQDEEPSNLTPSAYARRLKEQADSLVAQRQYAQAHRLLDRARSVDETVGAYRSFIQRTGDVAAIADSVAAD